MGKEISDYNYWILMWQILCAVGLVLIPYIIYRLYKKATSNKE